MSENKFFKNKRFQIYLPLLLAVVLVIGVFLGLNLNFKGAIKTPDNKFFSISFDKHDKINHVLNYVYESYVDTVDKTKLEESTIRSIIDNLDPHSSYITAEDFRDLNDPLMGKFEGIGIEFNMINDTVMVINPIPGGPSEKIGLMAGDRIVKVEGEDIAGVNISSTEVVHMLKGEKGTEVSISVYRRGVDELIDFTITRDEIPSYSLDIAYMVDDKTGYIKLSRFSATTHNEFRKALDRLKMADMSQLVLDLRGNQGGFMDAAINIADELLEPRNLIVYTDGRNRPKSYAHARRNGAFETQPLIVLIDEWSASASEIIAGAVQDNDRGLIVGRRSFGKGLVQEQVQLGDGSALRLTVARYYTPTGRSIQSPYEAGEQEEYFTSFVDRLMDDKPVEKDSLIHDSLKFETPAGRAVYGGGGIMPDVFVPFRTGENVFFFNKLVNRGLIYQFAFEYSDRNRQALSKYEDSDDFIKNFYVDNLIFNNFIGFINERGVEPKPVELEDSEELIKNYLKAYIGRNIYGNEAFYPVLHEKDAAFKKAVELLQGEQYITYLSPDKY